MSNASLTGQLYRKKDARRRDAAFTIHQFANTVAGILTPVVVGQIGLGNYHIGFATAILLTQYRFFGPLVEASSLCQLGSASGCSRAWLSGWRCLP